MASLNAGLVIGLVCAGWLATNLPRSCIRHPGFLCSCYHPGNCEFFYQRDGFREP